MSEAKVQEVAQRFWDAQAQAFPKKHGRPSLYKGLQVNFDSEQVLAKSQQRWKGKPLDPAAIALRVAERDRLKFQ
jgi:hypothetical protein